MITKVETNLKAGASVTLTPKTLVVGPNRAGKSTIVNAVELAATGRASDIAGRETLALDAELSTLIPAGAESGFARAWIGDQQLSWALVKGKKATRGAMPAPAPEVHFPLREVRENLTASPATARKWLLGRLSAATPWPTVLARVAVTLHEKLTTLAGGTVLGLPTAGETAKRQAREARRSAETLRVAPPPALPTAPPPAAAPAFDMAGAQKRLAAAKAGLDAAQKAAATVPAPAGASPVVQALRTVIQAQIASGAKACGVCSSTAADGAFQRRLAAVEQAAQAAADAAARHQAARAAVAVAEAEVREAQWAIESAQRAAEAATTAAESVAAAAVQANETKAVELEKAAAEWEALADAAERVMTALVTDARLAFEGRVQAFMPAGMTFGLDLVDGDREVTRFGLRQPDGSIRSALSGAEWAIVTVALASAVAPAGELSVIVPEERAFDPETLTAALRAFSNVHAQVIVTSPIMPSEVPAGWAVISVGAPVAAPVALPAATVQGALPEAPKRKPGRPRGSKNKAKDGALDGQTTFEPPTPPNPCPGCGVDLNIEGVQHSKTCTLIAAGTPDDAPPFM